MRRPDIPPGAEIVRSFALYEEQVRAFFEGCYHLFITVGRPGLSKSYSFERRLGPTSHMIRGWTAPLQAYIDTYRNRNKLLIFDDAEVLWKRPGGRVLLRSLCELKPRKLVQWASTARELVRAQVPQSFLTSSRVAIIANKFYFGDADEYEAILDRGHLIYFDPSPAEVHLRVADWFWDQEIYDYIGDRLHLIGNASSRLYIKAYERMKARGDWRKLIEEAYCHEGGKRFVQFLEGDPTCRTVDDRVKKFIEYTHCCRATYFNLKRELDASGQLHTSEKLEISRRQLTNAPPVELSVEEEVARAEEENRRLDKDSSQDEPGEGDIGDTSSDYLDECDTHPGTFSEDSPGDQEASPGDLEMDRGARLRRELKQAIDDEDYERAAELRDVIRREEEDEGDQEHVA